MWSRRAALLENDVSLRCGRDERPEELLDLGVMQRFTDIAVPWYVALLERDFHGGDQREEDVLEHLLKDRGRVVELLALTEWSRWNSVSLVSTAMVVLG